MKLRISYHAQYRALERGVSSEDIKKVISQSLQKKNTFDSRIEASLVIKGRIVTVIYKEKQGKFVIITVI